MDEHAKEKTYISRWLFALFIVVVLCVVFIFASVLLSIDSTTDQQTKTAYYVHTTCSEEPMRVRSYDLQSTSWGSSVLTVIDMEGNEIILSPHEWLRIEQVDMYKYSK